MEPWWVGSDVPRGPGPKGGSQEDPNQSSWLPSDHEQERDPLRWKAQALAVAWRFLSLFTLMKLRLAPQNTPGGHLRPGQHVNSHGAQNSDAEPAG